MATILPPSTPTLTWQPVPQNRQGALSQVMPSGCGAALVGSTDQVMSEIEDYRKMGIRAFIFSGYPHMDECRHFGQKVLPNLKTCSLPHEYGRVPAETSMTPLGAGERR